MAEVVYVDKHGNVEDEDDADLVARAEALDITESEIDRGGGSRKDEDGNVYFIKLPLLVEFEEKNDATPDDEAFWKWFTEFREEHGIAKKEQKRGWVGNSWRDNIGSGYSKSRDYMQEWWGDWGWGSKSKWADSSAGKATLGGEVDLKSRRFALALRAVETTVRVISEDARKFRVMLSDGDTRSEPVSATDFNTHTILVSPQALLDKDLDSAKQVEVTTGYALHEASHVKYSASILEALKEPTMLEPKTVAGLGFNVLEDVIIEEKTSERFPGFADYLDSSRAYIWDVTKDSAPKEWGPDLHKKLGAMVGSVKWPKEYGEIVTASGDARLADEYKWFNEWRDKYIGGRSMRESLVDLLTHLAEDPETKKQMAQMAAEEAKWEQYNGSDLSDDQLREMIRQMLKGDMLKPCDGGSGNRIKVPLDEETTARINKLIREEMRMDTPMKFPDASWGSLPDVMSVKPEQEADFDLAPPDALTRKLKGAFVFRRANPLHDDRLLKSGLIDDEEVWRVIGGDYRVMSRRVIVETPETSVTLLVDHSGSMFSSIGNSRSQTKLSVARRLARVMTECLKTTQGTRVRVRAHTTGGWDSQPILYRVYEPGDPDSRLNLIGSDSNGTLSSGCNWDGLAVEWCARELVRDARPDEQMVLIVLSDGLPNGGGQYSGADGQAHVRAVTDYWARQGVNIIQVALTTYLDEEAQASMYQNWLPFENEEKLPFQLTKLLTKFFTND